MKKQNILLVIIFLFILTLAVGYYVFRIGIDVKTKSSQANLLNVSFVKVGDIYQKESEGASAVIKNNGKNVIIKAPNLKKLGAYVIVPVTIKNNSEVPVRLYSIIENGTFDKSMISVTYTGIAVTDPALLPGEEKVIKVKIEWVNEEVSKYNQVSFDFKLNYVQA